MHITAFAQKRQVIIYLVAIVIILMGIFTFLHMPLMLLPQLNVPGAAIETTMIGATASQVDHEINKPMLNELNTLPNLNSLTSDAYPSISIINVEFKINTPSIAALQNIQEKVAQATPKLPSSANPPEIISLNYTNIPIMTLALQSSNDTPLQLSNYARYTLLRELLKIPGVLNATLKGDKTQAILVDIDPNKLAAYHINVAGIAKAFKQNNISFPGYFVDTTDKALLLNMNEQLTSINDVRNLIISENKGNIVRLKQIADVHYGAARTISAAQYNGKPAIGIDISRQANENTVHVIQHVKEYLKKTINKTLPKGMSLKIAYDDARSIISNVQGLEMTVIYAIAFACLIVYLFIRSIRSMIIIFIAIPISILFSILMLYVLGYSLNILTLLSIVLLVGLVVDDAIVVTENIYRVRTSHKDLTAEEGTLKGVKQVTFAVLASTISLLVIFASGLVMTGAIGTLFVDFSIAILFGVGMSYFVSMTVTPLLGQHFMVLSETENTFYRILRQSIEWCTNTYSFFLKYFLRFRFTTVIIIILLLAPVMYVLPRMGSSLFASHTDHAVIEATVRGPASANLSYMENMLKKVNSIIESNKAVASTYATVGPLLANKADMRINLKPESVTHEDSETVMSQLNNALNNLAGVIVQLRPKPISTGFGQSLSFAVTDNNYNTLINESTKFIIALDNQGELGSISSNLQPEQPQYKLIVNRDLAGTRGITSEMIMSAVALFGGHIKVGQITPDTGLDRTYSIYLNPKPGTLIDAKDLNKVYLFGNNGDFIQLSTIASLKRVLLPAKISRNHREFSITFSSTPQIATNHALRIVKEIGKKYLSPTSHIVATGETSSSQTAITSTEKGLIFAAIIMYIVLTIQFDSFVQPIIVLVTLPLALVGAIYVLYLCNFELSIFSLIGILLLMGLVAKNAILLVNRANQYRERGFTVRDSLQHACPERLVPISMTSLTIILAMIPVLTSSGVGSKNQIVMATTIVAGIVSSTILSVILVPALYDIIENMKEKFMAHFTSQKEPN